MSGRKLDVLLPGEQPAHRMKPKSNQAISRAACWMWLFLLLRILIGDALAHFPAASRGVTTAATQAERGLYLFTGEQIDPDLGMYYLRARYYQPATGRFWTMDSFEGRGFSPQTLHKYLYCHGNPLNGSDPSGNEMSLGGLSASMAIGGSINAAMSFRSGDALGKVGSAFLVGAFEGGLFYGVGYGIGKAADWIYRCAKLEKIGGPITRIFSKVTQARGPIAGTSLFEQFVFKVHGVGAVSYTHLTLPTKA